MLKNLRWRLCALKVRFNAGPHWWIKPTWDTSGSRTVVRGIAFVGPVEIHKATEMSHCLFRNAKL